MPELDGRRTRGTGVNPQIGVTFQGNHALPIYGWYPYVEGFSARYVNDVLDRFPKATNVFDPFGGAGTTQLAASMRGLESAYCEVNPFMTFIAETKINAARSARLQLRETEKFIQEYLNLLDSKLVTRARGIDLQHYEKAFPGRDFFEVDDIRELLAAVDLCDELDTDSQAVKAIIRLACAANAVGCSNMTRRADLRRRRADEYKTRVVNVKTAVAGSLLRMLDDLRAMPERTAETFHIGSDCRQTSDKYASQFELAITSPPYLNGTNYFRNTKIELWLTGYISTERDVAQYRNQAVAAGINNVTRNRNIEHAFEPVEMVASELDEKAGDLRIPCLVRSYFSDMYDVFSAVKRVLRPDGLLVLDIGDSKFYGVHVPTDRLLVHVADEVGLALESDMVLAKRYSRDKSELVQRELTFRNG
ncbi:restriction endonuclease [Mycobacteroides abscessus]|uniref:restriction endonuclease n=1 Tax=Mycobacteroides abscessus TaxID=36809 RepID=UPI000D3EC727|nr:restriction endonuclease [Mycobacteroides abscessus]PVB05050.1 restriction endonuclease [Mycobacteroides abscessus]RIT46032.1 restriction endonuclease [Mycobacteroides abscessus]